MIDVSFFEEFDECRLCYDITRVVSRRLSPIRTGIDRVDESVFSYILKNKKNSFFVFCYNGQLFRAPRSLCYILNTIINLKAGDTRLQRIYFVILNLLVSPLLPRIFSTPRFFANKQLLNICRLFSWRRPLGKVMIFNDKTLSDFVVYLNFGHKGYIFENDALFFNCGFSYTVFFCHDIFPIDKSSLDYREGSPLINVFKNISYLDSGVLVLTNSENTKVSINKSFPNISNIKVSQMLLPIASLSENCLSHSGIVKGDYFVFVGSAEPRKNIPFLFSVWDEIIYNIDIVPHLLVFSSFGSLSQELESEIQKCPLRKRYIHLIRGASDKRVLSSMKNSRAVLLPNLEEGFGIVLREALSCGAKVAIHREAKWGGLTQEEEAGVCQLSHKEEWVDFVLLNTSDKNKCR